MGNLNNELVGLIYDTALEPSKWSELLEALTSNLTTLPPDGNNANNHLSKNDTLALQQHLEKAFTISERLDINEKTTGLTQSIADLLPIPAMVVDTNLTVLSHNASFASISEKGSLFRICDNKFSSNSNTLMFKLRDHIANLASSSSNQFLTLRAQSAMPHKPTSLLVSKLSPEPTSDAYLILVAASQTQNYLSETMLAEIYGLTKAEQKLSLGIVRGESLTEIAVNGNTSIHTVRTQLKTVFSKVGVNRQSELMRVLLTSSLLNFDPSRFEADDVSLPTSDESKTAQICKLKDGRKLAYAEYGDLSGEPVFTFHPTTGSRLQSHPDNDMTRSYGVRLILVDRPGFGLSTRHEGRTFLSFASDIDELATSLNITTFSLLGYCGGGPYALACAHQLGSRVKQLTIVSGVTPYDGIDVLHGISTINRMLVKIATLLPDSIFHLASILAKRIITEPEIYLDELQGGLCANDKASLNEPEFLDNFMVALAESLRQGPGELAAEQILFSQDWGFEVEQISVSTDLWYGDQDKHVPIALAQRLSSNLQHARFHEIENYGHFLIYHKWSGILDQHMSKLKQQKIEFGT
jgi:pimeloyl-ACP methyl ester carboxylesterase/DNA-binding CsgD family transcriptional regulator